MEASPVGAPTLYHTSLLLSTTFWWRLGLSLAAASVLPAGVPSRCAPAHGRAGGGLLLALLPYRSRRCSQRAAWPSFGRAVSVHAGGPRGRCAFGAGGLPLPDGCGWSWGFCGCCRDWAEPIGAARCLRGDARDKKGLDKTGGVWYGVGCREHFAKSINLAKTCYSLQFKFSEVRVRVPDDSNIGGPFLVPPGKR